MGTQTQLSYAELEEAAPVVSYLGPVSSYTHQVIILYILIILIAPRGPLD
jgi:hypothetical protein